MSFEIRKAQRKNTKIRVGVSGPSGSGKTTGALLIARGLCDAWNEIAVIDTEQGSAEMYSHLGDYSVLTLEPPFSPDRYIQAIHACEKAGFKCIVIDSASHEWDGTGGCLEIYEKLGGQFHHWAKVTPMHRKFIDAILQSKAHIVTTTRKKQDYALEQNERGKATPKKIGLKEIQREGFEYELTVAFDVGINHHANLSKDRTGIFSWDIPFMITEATGKKIRDWNESGAQAVANDSPRLIGADEIKALVEAAQASGISNDAMKALIKMEGGADSAKQLTVQGFEKVMQIIKLKEAQA